MKQTAVEWLANEMPVIDWKVPYWKIKLEKAKAMERQQMIDFARNIIIDATCSVEGYVTTEKDIEDYYNETFNTNEK